MFTLVLTEWNLFPSTVPPVALHVVVSLSCVRDENCVPQKTLLSFVI